MDMRRNTAALLLSVCLIVSFGCDGSKVRIDGGVETLASDGIFDSMIRGEVAVTEIQHDQFQPGYLLASVGSAIFTVSMFEIGNMKAVSGSLQFPGNEWECNIMDGRYRNITGFAQIKKDREMIIVSDMENRCLKSIDRAAWWVDRFAGKCDNTTLPVNETCEALDGDLRMVATFCAPKTLQYLEDRDQIMVLDGTKIRLIDLNTSTINTVYDAGRDLTSFKYIEDSDTFLLNPEDGMLTWITLAENMTETASDRIEHLNKTHCNTTEFSTNHSRAIETDFTQVTEMNGLYFASTQNDILMLDFENDLYASLREQIDKYLVIVDRDAMIIKPYAVSKIGGYLYFGNKVHFSKNDYLELSIKRIRLSVDQNFTVSENCSFWVCCDDEWLDMVHQQTTPSFTIPPWFPTWYPTDDPTPPPIIFPTFPDDDSGSTYYSSNYYYAGFGGCVFFVPCFYVYRRRRRNAVVVRHQRLVDEPEVTVVTTTTATPTKGKTATPSAVLPTYAEACAPSSSTSQP